jgi:hypothetical protein
MYWNPGPAVEINIAVKFYLDLGGLSKSFLISSVTIGNGKKVKLI